MKLYKITLAVNGTYDLMVEADTFSEATTRALNIASINPPQTSELDNYSMHLYSGYEVKADEEV